MKFLILLCFIAGIVCLNAQEDLEETHVQQEWTAFKTKFNRIYQDVAEEASRLQIFRKTLKKIADHNEKHKLGEVSFTLGINQFADKTPEEFRRSHGGLLRVHK